MGRDSKPRAEGVEASTRALVMFTKPAVPGRVKTRLIGQLSPEQAAELHRAFVEDLSRRLTDGRFDFYVAWALDPGQSLDLGIGSLIQEGNDLGDRLFRCLDGLTGRYSHVAAVGSDHPDLPLSRIHSAFDLLDESADVVIGPAHDGGYYLIALRAEVVDPRLFDGVEWSSSAVLAGTLDRCRDLGLRTELLEPAFDVDTPEDLDRLIGDLVAYPDLACPATRELLSEWKILEASEREETDEDS